MKLLKEARLQDDNLMQIHRESVSKKAELINALDDIKNRVLVGKEQGYYPAKVVSVHLARVIKLHNVLIALWDAENAEFLRYLDEAHIDTGEDS